MKIKATKTEIKIFVLFAILLMPELFAQIKPLFYVNAALSVCIFALYVYKLNESTKWPAHLVIWTVACVYLLLVMIVNGNISDVDQWGKTTIYVLDLILVLEYFIRKRKTEELLSAISSLGVVYFLLNILSFLLFPEGFVRNVGGVYHFLGTRNVILRYFFAFLTAAGLQYEYYGKKKQLIIIILAGVFHFLYFKVATAVACCLLIVGFLLVKDGLKRMMSMKTILLISTLLSVGFVFFDAEQLFAWFIENVLHKDIGLNSRSRIWAIAIENIFDSKAGLWLGHGIVNNGHFIYMDKLYWPAHNQLLNWLYEYGIIGVSILYLFFFKLEKNIEKKNDLMFVYAICFAIFIGSISSSPLASACGFLPLCILPYMKYMREDAGYA